MPDTPVIKLQNIGKVTAAWLNEIGVFTRADLERCSPVLCYRVLKHRHGDRIELVLLYALHAALQDRHFLDLTEAERAALRGEAEEPVTIRYRA